MPAVSAARAARRNASAKKKLLAQDRRNAMSQMSHRKSLVRGIISVASGEVIYILFIHYKTTLVLIDTKLKFVIFKFIKFRMLMKSLLVRKQNIFLN